MPKRFFVAIHHYRYGSEVYHFFYDGAKDKFPDARRVIEKFDIDFE